MPRKPQHLCYVLCYKQPNYTRTRSLLRGLEEAGIEVIPVINRRRGLLRYLEIPLRLAKVSLKERPSAYVVGFRGHEVFWLLYPWMRGRPIIFDEFINLHDWLVNEHQKFPEKHWMIRLVDTYMRWVMRKSALVLTDTEAHRRLCAEVYGVPLAKIAAVPVGADEAVFYPRQQVNKSRAFEVFFYGNMLPLHGIGTILEAIGLVRDTKKDIHFTLVGGAGDERMIQTIQDFIDTNNLQTAVTHLPWVELPKLPDLIARADVCLGGPFGGTGQARRVVTGKTYQFIAMGKPTIIGRTDQAGAFVDRKNCLIVPQKDAAALKDAIIWASRHPKQLPGIGRNAEVLYRGQFSPQALGRLLGTLFGRYLSF